MVTIPLIGQCSLKALMKPYPQCGKDLAEALAGESDSFYCLPHKYESGGLELQFRNSELLLRFLKAPTVVQQQFVACLSREFRQLLDALQIEVRWGKKKYRIIEVRQPNGFVLDLL